ncbi:uncharacterized protein LOC120675686 [Panicum virgatum]|uniref:Uncharacterized protein n=1 Tax=Panicum virgatum TaxID=38727 RepID=A0A8T0RLQ4_PANVG|nr:uncharacterized protein LOC120675686 [Panicum virgatum]KAG2586937.1 hypothetical protein PVAP13_5NG093100 [Panicum virgatum]
MATAVASPGPTTLRMKLLVDTRAQRLLFAEASKDAVDFLFSLLALPVGTVVMLLGQDAVPGSVGGLYGSVENLERSYARPGVDMDALLRPVVPPPAAGSVGPILGLVDVSARPRCPSCGGRPPREASQVTYATGGSHGTLTILIPTVDPSEVFGFGRNAAAGGFVQGNTTYTVMDDLAVAPMSTISSISIFNAMAMRDLGAVQERTVHIGHAEALMILKASLESKTMLTDVFLRGRAPAPAMLARRGCWCGVYTAGCCTESIGAPA